MKLNSQITKVALLLMSATMMMGCEDTSVKLGNSPTSYAYGGERYGLVSVGWSQEIATDPEKISRLEDTYLDKAIANRLIANKLYDPGAERSINVVVTTLDSNKLEGQVVLKNKEGQPVRQFTVSVKPGFWSRDPRGQTWRVGPDGMTGWLGDKFGELTATTILK